MVQKETVELKTVSKVSKVRIQPLGGLISSNVKASCPQKANSGASDSKNRTKETCVSLGENGPLGDWPTIVDGQIKINGPTGATRLNEAGEAQISNDHALPRTKDEAKSSWASLFGSRNGNSMIYTPPTSVGDKVVVTPIEEIIAQGVRVWENSCNAVETNYLQHGVNTLVITLIPKRSGADRMEDFWPIISCCNVIY